jgi:hypothetical protein
MCFSHMHMDKNVVKLVKLCAKEAICKIPLHAALWPTRKWLLREVGQSVTF